MYSMHGWWYYFSFLVMYKVPLACFFLLMLLFAGAGDLIKDNLEDHVFMVVVAVAYFVFFSFFCHVQLGLRYILPVFPIVYTLIGGVGLRFDFVRQRKFAFLVSALLSWFAWSSVMFFPHYIQYSNELIPNKMNTYLYFSDSNLDWGQSGYSIKRFTEELDAKGIEWHSCPDEPVKGIVVIAADILLDIREKCRGLEQKHRWLREGYRPIGHVAYNWLVFNVDK